jgi:hypothetical protein
MKFNIKTAPRLSEIEPRNAKQQPLENLVNHMNKVEAWFEAFEKELKERLASDGTFKYKRPKQRTRTRTTQLGKFIKEILGEAKHEEM